MAKNEIIALAAEGDALRGVRFVPRGRDSWARVGGGEWPLKEQNQPPDLAPAAEFADGGVDAGTVVATDTPMFRGLTAAKSELGADKVVIALPLSRLMTRIIKVPVEMRDDIQSAVALQMDKFSPFQGEEQSVGCEILSETETDLWVFAAAMPEPVYEKIREELESVKLKVVRTDVAVLGWFRSLCGPCKLVQNGRRLVMMNIGDGWDLLVLDNGCPVLARNLGTAADPVEISRELTISLMNIELDAGSSDASDILVISSEKPEEAFLETLRNDFGIPATWMKLPNPYGGVEGVALRTGEGATMDLTPQSWRDDLRERTIRKRVLTFAGIAMAIWAVAMGVLFAGPAVYTQMTNNLRKKSRSISRSYKQVADTRERVNLILKYTDRSYSTLEMLRMISEQLPEGITLTSINYKRNEGLKISGEADQSTQVYELKDKFAANKLFSNVSLTGPSVVKGKNKFDINAQFPGGKEKK